MYRSRYWNDTYFAALTKVENVAAKYGLTLAEVALRWVSHHSLMKREYGDAILIGASSVAHIKQNLEDLDKGPLRECFFPLSTRSLCVHHVLMCCICVIR